MTTVRGSETASDMVRAVPRPEPSALVERIARIAEQLEHAPPPRQMTVEVGDLRLSVTLRSDGAVRVVFLGEQGQPLGAAWQRELADALADRGFDLARQDGGRGQAAPDDEPPRQQGRNRVTVAAGVDDGDLRL